MVQNIFRSMHQVYSLCHYSSVLGLGVDRGNSVGEAPVHVHGQAEVPRPPGRTRAGHGAADSCQRHF